MSTRRLAPALALTALVMGFTTVAAKDSFPLLGDPQLAARPNPVLVSSVSEPEGGSHDIQPVHKDGAVAAPVVVEEVLPIYPEEARKAGLEGSVTVETIIDDSGLVQELKILFSTDPVFEAPVLEALPEWQFRPATRKWPVSRRPRKKTILRPPPPPDGRRAARLAIGSTTCLETHPAAGARRRRRAEKRGGPRLLRVHAGPGNASHPQSARPPGRF